MSDKAALSVVGAAVGEPRAVPAAQTSSKTLSAASLAAVVPQPAVGGGASSAAPQASKKSASSGKKKAKSSSSSSSSHKSKAHKDDDDDDEEGGEDIIPMKVPLSDSDGEDDEPAAPATASSARVASPGHSASGTREKTFLSEVDMEELKPQAFATSSAKSDLAAARHDGQSQRAAEEKQLAEAEARATYRPRADWATESSSDRVPTEVFCCTWSPDSRFLAAGCGDGSIRVFNAGTGKIAYILRASAAASLGSAAPASASGLDLALPVTCIRFRPESATHSKGVLLATSADGHITHWHMASQTCLYSLKEAQETADAQVYTCDYTRDGERFVTGGRDGVVRLYDESTKALVSSLTAGRDKGTTGHSNRVYVAKWHPTQENMIVSGGWDNTVQIWDTRAGYSVRSIYGPHLCGDALDISPDGHTILTGSWRPKETLQRWELATGKLIDTVPFAAGPGGLGADRPELLYAAAYAPDGRSFAAGGCGTNESKLFSNDASSPKVLERISAGAGGVYCLSFAPSGKKIAMGGGGNTVTVVDL